MSFEKETEDWKLAAFIEWRPKPKHINCTCCNGKGTVGGHFKDLDDPQTCPECYGSGFKMVFANSKMPEIPEELIEHMRRAWYDFFHKQI